MAKTRWPANIRPHGDGIQIRFTKGGRHIYAETLPGDPFSPGDLAAAVRRRDELKSRIRLGLPLFEGEQSSAIQFVEAAQSYLDALDAGYATHMQYEGIINRVWVPAFGNWLLTDIQTRHIKAEMARRQVSQKTKKNDLIPLRGVLNHYEINPNPAATVKLKKHQKAEIQRFTPDERDRILAKLRGQHLVYFTIMFATGMRPSEVIALTWDDYRDGYLYVSKAIVRARIKDTKNHERRKVYVPSWARPIISQHTTRFEGGFIFRNSVGRYHETKPMNRAWRKALKAAKLPYRIPYVCRHSRAAEMLSTGVEPGDAAKQLGHTLEVFYRTYAEFIEAFTTQKDDSRFEGAGVSGTGQKQDTDSGDRKL